LGIILFGPGGGAVDLLSFARNLGLEEEEFLDLVELFIEATTADLRALVNAAGKRDLPKVWELAHSINGASINLGFTEISSLAKQIEMKARNNLLEGVPETAFVLGNHLNSLKEGFDHRVRV
jgi:HPt (histidine-containing phosphotransfer) domain-containing protein